MLQNCISSCFPGVFLEAEKLNSAITTIFNFQFSELKARQRSIYLR